MDLNESVDYLFGFFQPVFNKKKLPFIFENSLADKKIILQTDKNKLESILSNFIKNAIKFTHEGFVEFGVNQTDNSILFYVRDTGIGIPAKRHEAIFERFVQADLKITKPYEGSGLGLSISRAYADFLGGEISVKSEEGKGSTFSFFLPQVFPERSVFTSEKMEKAVCFSGFIVTSPSFNDVVINTGTGIASA